jgi:hypothetical protein
MELLKEIAFYHRIKPVKAGDLKAGDLTTFGRVREIKEDGRVLVFKFGGESAKNLAVLPDYEIGVII